ncbi:SMC family ATPase [[Clostridium] innocuum]|uniref:SbcC/MukB-like Walker B domain-containing protein n=1 Tax=Clostridium innocuum TaxID=1522 RepID=UPI001E5CFDC6|nr:SMC family ATPase [[Clostridium] innocuum]MCC2834757.1 SMC family ATPase [[Clostridium] innocuum]
MRPEILKLQAFGPYVKQQCINFHVFDEQHLFLIQGETGSGKTMLLDAMTYALYGKSSGSQREDLYSMRSRFAEVQDATVVDFQFQLHQRTYRFVRTITMRKKRNQELTPQMQIDAGEIVDGEFVPFFENPKLKNVEEKAVELLGLSYAQFVQVMILPQGKFEQLLTSKSEEKQEILKTLFQMERWTGINQALSDTMKQKREQLDMKKQRREALLSGIEMQSPEEITVWLKHAGSTRRILEQEVKQKQELLEQIKQEAAQQRLRKEQLTLLQQAELDWERLLQQEEDMKQLYVYLERQKELIKVLPEWNTLQQCRNIWKQRVDNLHAVAKQHELLNQQKQAAPLWQTQLQEYKGQEQNLRQKLHEAQELRPLVQQLQQLLVKENALRELQDKQQQLVEQKQKHCSELNSNKEQLRQKIETAQLTLDGLEHAAQHFVVWRQADYHEQQRIQHSGKLKAEEAEEKELILQIKLREEQLIPLQQAYDEAMRTYLNNSAVQLAALLKEHEPCPVCGSTTHPALAETKAAYQDVVQLKQLQERLDQEKEAVQGIQQQLEHVRLSIQMRLTAMQEHEKAIQTLLQQPFSQTEFTRLQQKQQQAEQLNLVLHELLQQQERLQQKQEEEDAALQQLQQKQQELHTEALLNDQQRTVLQDSIPCELRSPRALNDCLQQLQQELDLTVALVVKQETRLRQLEINLAQQQRDHEHAQKEEQQAKQALQASEISWQAVAQNRIQEEEMQGLKQEDLQKREQQMQEYALKKEQLKTRIQDLQQRCAAIAEQNLEALLAQQEQLMQEVEQLQLKLADITTHETMYLQVQASITQIQKELDVEEPAFVELAHFVRVMRGDNGMGIERYVLGIMLGSITQQANQLLKLVHNGRYQIFRSDEASGRTRKYGLELSIYDSFTCNTRSVVSLSGGEKFLVSLALSLALSAVVQARNGGIQLDTMFIDEGFGTLDEHSIADALAVLQIMSSSRGYVGIISHVELLKENIPAGILVEKSREGSHVQIRKV